MENEVICYYHANCNDGMMSAMIAGQAYSPRKVKYIPIQYGEYPMPPILEECTGKIVVMVDFSMGLYGMKEIKKVASEFIWIDHHKTAKENCLEIWYDIAYDGLRDHTNENGSGAMLTWLFYETMIREKLSIIVPVPRCVQLVSDYDIWKFEFGDRTKYYYESFSMNVNEEKLDYFKDAILLDYNTISWEHEGMLLFKAKMNRVEKAYGSGHTAQFYTGSSTTENVRWINSQYDISETGDYSNKRGHTFTVIWSQRGDHNIVVSLRSVGDYDVSLIAKQFGGGGHKNAAGFTLFSLSELERLQSTGC